MSMTLAALAQTQEQLRDLLLELTPLSDADLRAARDTAAKQELAALTAEAPRPGMWTCRTSGWCW